MEAGFRIEVAPVPEVAGAVTLRLGGSVTRRDASSLRKRILAEIRQTEARRVVLSLGGVEHMDTAAAAVLVEAVQIGRRRGLRVLLCSPSESVVRFFRMAGLLDIIDACTASPAETLERLLA